jgi:hypothetical protein
MPSAPRLAGDVSQRHRRQRPGHRLLGIRKGVMDVARAVTAAQAAAQDAGPAAGVALDGLDDGKEMDVGGGASQPIAAGTASAVGHQSGPHEVAQDLRHEADGDGGEVRQLCGRALRVRVTGKDEHRADRVVAPSCELELHDRVTGWRSE